MEKTFYLEDFQRMAAALKSELLTHRLEVAAVTYGDAVVLKLYRASWANPSQDPLTAETRIFFSVWTKEQPLKKQKTILQYPCPETAKAARLCNRKQEICRRL